MRAALKWTAWLVVGLLAALALLVLFGLQLLRQPIERAVAEATGRELRFERLRPAWDWVYPRFRAEGVRFGNAAWASEPLMLSAEAIEASISLAPLLRGRVELPDLRLEGARLNLEQDADGRRNWVLRPDEEQEGPLLFIHHLTIDKGVLAYTDPARGISMHLPIESLRLDGVRIDLTASSGRSAASGATEPRPPSRSAR